jgi:hypothetical protein
VARTTEALILRAIVQTLRANTSLYPQLTGGVHEGIAPRDAKYPFVTIDLVAVVVLDDWSGRQLQSDWDVVVWHEQQVEASNLDSSVMNTLEDNLVAIDGQQTLICRRIAGVRLPEVTEEGKRIYRVGGTYRIWTDQPR